VVENFEKNKADAIIQALNNPFIFTCLTEEDKDMAMQLSIFEPFDIVFEQHLKSKSFFVIRSGLLEVISTADSTKSGRVKALESLRLCMTTQK
jgi:CRP-like cAMP-binding protein